jgi:hypothetical protein
MEPPVVDLLARPESAGNQERVHGRLVREAVVGENGKAGLSLDWPQGVGDQEGLELRIEAARHGENPMWSGEIHDLDILENVDPEAKAGHARG